MALLTLVGCASSNAYAPPTTTDIAAAEEAVAAAKKSGAAQGEPSARYVQVAEEQLVNGKQLAQQGDNRNAVWSLARAAADGELAYALNRQMRAESDARRLERQLAETRRESVTRPPVDSEQPPSAPQ